MKIDETILKEAIERWGYLPQLDMVVEECAELIKAIQKSKRPSDDTKSVRDNIVDEIADVTILMSQCKIIFGEKAIQERIDFKMKRLKERLNK